MQNGSENLTSSATEKTSADFPSVSHSDAPGLSHREMELEAENLELAAELIESRRGVYMLAGMVSGLLAALWLVLLFQRGER